MSHRRNHGEGEGDEAPAPDTFSRRGLSADHPNGAATTANSPVRRLDARTAPDDSGVSSSHTVRWWFGNAGVAVPRVACDPAERNVVAGV